MEPDGLGGRVLRVVTRLNRGGPWRQLCALVPALARWGWTGPVLAGSTEPHEPDGMAELVAAGARVVRVPGLRRGLDPAADARVLRRLLTWIRRERPDLVHTHMGKAGALGRIAARLAGVPTVHTFHGHHLQAPWPRDHLACLSERVLGRATRRAICLTPRQRRDLCEIHRPLGADKVAVVGPGVDVAAIRAAAVPTAVDEIRRRLVPDGRPLFVWAGRFVPVKDPLLLARAVAGARSPFRLVMLGDGPLRPAVRRFAEEAGIGAKLLCPGPVRETAPWILASRAVVLSSASEGAPVFLVEAKVLGRPALATTVGGVPDLVRHGIDGLWVPPGSCHDLARGLDLLATDEGLTGRLGCAAAEDAEARFGAERLARETVAVYEQVLGPSASRPEARRPGRGSYPRLR